MKPEDLDPIIEAALREDMPHGDITSENIVPADLMSEAVFLAKQRGILAGLDVARRVFEKIDSTIGFLALYEDGQSFCKGDILAEVTGPSISLLKGERTALNFLQRMSGIATTTRAYVESVADTRAKILDTRKTTPGLRVLEKYAVRMGGGENHRHSLSEMVLIKDNHLELVRSISEAVKTAKRKVKPGIKIEVEVSNLSCAQEAVEAGADMLMLDNMTLKKMKEVVRWVSDRVPLEVSGKVRLGNVRAIAALGVDFISIGALTHSYKSIDISLEFLS